MKQKQLVRLLSISAIGIVALAFILGFVFLPKQDSKPSSQTSTNQGKCKIAGCSNQLCVDEKSDGISTCEYREEYACYKTAECKRQQNGECGFTQTKELTECVIKNR